MSTHVMLSAFKVTDIPYTGPVKVVRDRDCEPFTVERAGSRYYNVANRTHFLAGSRCVRSVKEIRDTIMRA